MSNFAKNKCPYCKKLINLSNLYVFDDDDKTYWHFQCAIEEREQFENKILKG